MMKMKFGFLSAAWAAKERRAQSVAMRRVDFMGEINWILGVF
jgi:hypothetical protein